MSNSSSDLNLLTVGQKNKEIRANSNFNAASPAQFFARDDVTSVGLTWGYMSATIRNASNVPTQIAKGTLPLTANATNYIYHTYGAITCTTTPPAGWPGPLGAGAIALYTVVCNSTGATSWTDWRNMGADPVTYVRKRVGTLAYSATPTFDWSAYDVIRITMTGNITSFTMSGAVDGQNCQIEFIQDATGGRSMGAWGSQIRVSADLSLPVLSTAANKTDKVGFQYSGAAGKYDLVAVLKGF